MALRLSIREPMAPGSTLVEQWKNLRTLGIEGVELTRGSNLSELDNIKAALQREAQDIEEDNENVRDRKIKISPDLVLTKHL